MRVSSAHGADVPGALGIARRLERAHHRRADGERPAPRARARARSPPRARAGPRSTRRASGDRRGRRPSPAGRCRGRRAACTSRPRSRATSRRSRSAVREVEAGGRRGDGALGAREDGLVALARPRRRTSRLMYGGSGTWPAAVRALVDRRRRRASRARTSKSPSSALPSNSTTSASLDDARAGPQRLRRACERPPALASPARRWSTASPTLRTRKISLLPPVPSFVPEDARRNDLRVVDDDERARGDELGELGDRAVLQRAARRHDEEPRLLALGGGRLRDQLGRQRVVERARRASRCNSAIASARPGRAERRAGRATTRSRRRASERAAVDPSDVDAPEAASACQRRRELGGPETFARMKLTTSPTSYGFGMKPADAAVGALELPFAEVVGARQQDPRSGWPRLISRASSSPFGPPSSAASGRRARARRASPRGALRALARRARQHDLEALDAKRTREERGVAIGGVDEEDGLHRLTATYASPGPAPATA